MSFSQYLRLDLLACATAKQVVKACHTKLSTAGKSRAYREVRHTYIRDMLEQHGKAQDLTRYVMSGQPHPAPHHAEGVAA